MLIFLKKCKWFRVILCNVPFYEIPQLPMKKILITIFLLLTAAASFSQTVIQMKKNGGVSVVPCIVNGLSLSFIFDTGASDVSISLTEALFMFKNGYLKKEDILGSENYLNASGNIEEGITINLREIEIGGLQLYNIKATIVKSMDAPLLLGQSALSKLGTINLDLSKNELTILNTSKSSTSEIKKITDVLTNSRVYKSSFFLLAKMLITPTINYDILSKYFTVNTTGNLTIDSLWYSPAETYKALNASSYCYTFIPNKNKELTSDENSLLVLTFNNLKTFSQQNGIDWILLDTTSVVISSYIDSEITFSFKCGNKSYGFVTNVSPPSTDSTHTMRLFLPYRIDSKSFFQFRKAVYNKFLRDMENIKYSVNQDVELSYFYEYLINNFENDYEALSLNDKQKYSSIDFEPAYWCERAANLKPGDDEILKSINLLTKGISLFEKYPYPKMRESFYYRRLYAYRGEYKYRLEDYSGAYADYKTVLNIYEKNLNSRDAFKLDITEYYYSFSNICFDLKKYAESMKSIQKGINTYSKNLDKYLVYVSLYDLYNLKGYLNYFIYKNKEQACKDWSRAGELGDKEAYDFIKKYCNK